MKDPALLAIEIFDEVAERAGDKGSEVRARLRELPTMMRLYGMSTSIAFYLSKAKTSGEEAGQGGSSSSQESSESTGTRESAHAIVLDAIIRFLKEFPALGYKGGDDHKQLLRWIVEEGKDNDLVTFQLLMEFITYLKRLAEAEWRE